MKYSFAAVAFLVAGAIAAPTAAVVEDRRMTAIHLLYDNRESLQLTAEETDLFEKLMGMMGEMHTRDTEAGAPMAGAPMTTGGAAAGGDAIDHFLGSLPEPLKGILKKIIAIKGGAAGGMMNGGKKGGLLGGILIPGLL